MQLSMPVRLAVVVGAVLIIIAVVVGLILTGGEIDPGDLLTGAGVLLGGILAGIGAAGGPSRGAGVALIIASVLGLSACGAAPCQIEQSVVSALDAGTEAADASIPDDAGEDAELALLLTRGAVMLGQAAVDGCDLARSSAGWQAWVGLALEAAGGLAAIFGAAGPEDVPRAPPAELTGAIVLLEAEVEAEL